MLPHVQRALCWQLSCPARSIKRCFAAQRAQPLPLCLNETRKRTSPKAFAEDGRMSLNKRIGFMGAGQMAEALARGLIDKGVVQASQICCSDPAAARKELFRSLGATPYDSNLEVSCAASCCCQPGGVAAGWPNACRTSTRIPVLLVCPSHPASPQPYAGSGPGACPSSPRHSACKTAVHLRHNSFNNHSLLLSCRLPRTATCCLCQ